MNILYIEPYYSGSHKKWIDSYQKHSIHTIDILSLPGNKWKWRMHGGAVTLAQQLNNSNKTYDLILCSDFLNLPVFKSLISKKQQGPFIMYFHENQLSYPWSPDDDDKKLNRDLHYHYINYTSSLVSDFNLFNSNYHFKSYISSLQSYLKKMPDFNNFETLDFIKDKSDILYIGCDLNKFDLYKNSNSKSNHPIILWNHRWEFDKNPELFFNTLFKLKEDNVDFDLVVLGENFSKYPEIFDRAKSILKDNILHFGYCENFEDYAKWLWNSDILPVTSNQDFFGISIMEAVYCNVQPILPDRLTYPELFKKSINSDFFYDSDSSFYQRLKNSIQNKHKINISHINKFDWSIIHKEYDKTFNDLAKMSIKL